MFIHVHVPSYSCNLVNQQRGGSCDYIQPRVNNKKRRARYMLCIRCLRKVTCQEFKDWPMRALASNGTSWAWPRVQANTSTISLRTLVDNNIKRAFMKNLAQNSQKRPLFFTVLRKIKCLAPRASHVCKAGSHVIQCKHLVWSIARWTLSLLSTLDTADQDTCYIL